MTHYLSKGIHTAICFHVFLAILRYIGCLHITFIITFTDIDS